MKPLWQELRKELTAWRVAGLTPRLWWRDDDAIEPTPALDRLEALAVYLDLPVHLAVIPRDARTALSEHVFVSTHLIPVVHGWAHANHAPSDEKKAEFGQPRGDAEQELAEGLARSRRLFGSRLQPLFVPPWNRLHQDFLPVLQNLGYQAVSTYGTADLGSMLPFVNTHLDPIDWRGTRGLLPPETLIESAVAQLRRNRGMVTSADPLPFGLLTHHLVHDDAIWEFCKRFLAEMLAGGATTWTFAKSRKDSDEPA